MEPDVRSPAHCEPSLCSAIASETDRVHRVRHELSFLHVAAFFEMCADNVLSVTSGFCEMDGVP